MLSILTHTHKKALLQIYTMKFYISIIYLFVHVLSYMSLDAQ